MYMWCVCSECVMCIRYVWRVNTENVVYIVGACLHVEGGACVYVEWSGVCVCVCRVCV